MSIHVDPDAKPFNKCLSVFSLLHGVAVWRDGHERNGHTNWRCSTRWCSPLVFAPKSRHSHYCCPVTPQSQLIQSHLLPTPAPSLQASDVSPPSVPWWPTGRFPWLKIKKQLAIFITWGWSSTWWNQPCFPYISRLTSATGGLPSESDLSNDLPPYHQIVVPVVASFPWLTPWRWGHKAKRKLSGGMTSLIALRKLKLALLVQVSNHPCRRNPTCVNKR